MNSHPAIASRTAVVLAALVALAASSLKAQVQQQGDARTTPPTGTEIAAAAKASRLDAANAATGVFQGKSMKFTPAQGRKDARLEDLEAGAFAGVMETEATGDETGLPPGRYNVMIAKVGGQWKAYAESNGKIVRESARCDLKQASSRITDRKPLFVEKGWCWWIWGSECVKYQWYCELGFWFLLCW